MKLIDNWRAVLRSYSAIVLSLLSILPVIWAELPPELVVLIPAGWLPWIVSVVALAGLVGRFVNQGLPK